jgi:hypothetical protein
MVYVDPDALRAAGGRFESQVAVKLGEARQALRAAQSLNYADFTTVQVALASVLVESWNFAYRDLESKIDATQDFRTGLRVAAENWEAAEAASTVREEPGGGR